MDVIECSLIGASPYITEPPNQSIMRISFCPKNYDRPHHNFWDKKIYASLRGRSNWWSAKSLKVRWPMASPSFHEHFISRWDGSTRRGLSINFDVNIVNIPIQNIMKEEDTPKPTHSGYLEVFHESSTSTSSS